MKSGVVVILLLMGMIVSEIITLEDLRWKNRVLLVFPSLDDEFPLVWEMTESLLAEIEDRDLIYFVFADSLITNSSFYFDESYEENLKARYALGTKNICWVLLGKDGGLKLRQEGSNPDWELLFATIDSMPMRQKEINRDN